MNTAIAAALLVGASLLPPHPGIFEKVIANRERWGQIDRDDCPECVGYAAMLWPEDLGRTVCVDGHGPLLVVDMAAAHHRAGLIAKGWIIDVDRQTWLELEFMDTPTMVTVTNCEGQR